MKRTLLTSILLLVGFAIYAQIPTGYYDNANGKTGDELKAALHDIIKNHQTVSYAELLNVFAYTDCDANGKIWDIYSNYHYDLTDNGESFTQEGQGWNREHTWPQSWFNEQTKPRSDLFHVYPTDGYVNGRRSNYPYGEVNSPTYTSGNGSKLGPCVVSGYSGTVFEPIDEYKGDIARSYFYLSVRYYTEDDNWSTSAMTNKSEIEDWAMTMLLRWSDEDPVSDKEINRNNAIYGYQHNRNPFIDHPEYARMIWDPDWTPSTPTGGDYVKVTSTDQLEDGDYLIVCENNNVAFNGALTNSLNAENNRIAVTISDGTIESTTEVDAAVFTLTHVSENTYTIQSASGYYIGLTSNSNSLQISTTNAYTNTISMNGEDADIVSSGGAYLRYNAQSGQERFRFYKSGTYTSQQPIQLYKKNETYTVTLASVTHGTITANPTEAAAGSTITLTATPDAGYEFETWTVTDASNNPISVTGNQFIMPASNVTVNATFTYVGAFTQHYYLVTDSSQLVAGRTYLIVNTQNNKALGTTQNGNNRSAGSVTVNNEVIESIDGTVCNLTLGGENGAWTFYDATNNGYLYAAGGTGNNNYLKTQNTLTNEGKWTIVFDNNNNATIKTIVSTVARHTIMYNNGSSIFSCYASGQQSVQLFILSQDTTYTANTTLACLNTFDRNVIQPGVSLTANKVLGPSNQPQNIIIQEGAQLIHTTEGLQATVKRTIQAYTNDGGWYTIAAPFTNTDTSQFTTANYDLYYYDEDGDNEGKEWINFKTNAFTLTSGTGYLYAHNPSTTLRLTGTLNSGTYSPIVNLSYGNNDTNLKGYNLLGNPTAHEITYTKTESVSDGYYYLNNSSEWAYSTEATVPIGRGFLLKANASGQSVTLNPQSKGDRHQVEQYLAVSIDGEQAYVKLTEGVSMPLLSFRGHSSSVYLNHEGQPYIMLVRDGANSIELNYRAPRQGRHQLQVDTQGANLPYLHLYDRLTGADIDLLQSPNYAFESATGNYASRFQLVFDPNESHEEDAFAYYANGRIVVDGPSDAILQIIDLTGRLVPNEHIVPGLYVLRLITPERVRIQKIVID